MLTVIADIFAAVAALVGIIVYFRTRAPKYYNIPAAEIHPDLAAGEELLQDALDEARLGPTTPRQ